MGISGNDATGARFCPHCGTGSDVGHQFCRTCGQPLQHSESEPATETFAAVARLNAQPVTARHPEARAATGVRRQLLVGLALTAAIGFVAFLVVSAHQPSSRVASAVSVGSAPTAAPPVIAHLSVTTATYPSTPTTVTAVPVPTTTPLGRRAGDELLAAVQRQGLRLTAIATPQAGASDSEWASYFNADGASFQQLQNDVLAIEFPADLRFDADQLIRDARSLIGAYQYAAMSGLSENVLNQISVAYNKLDGDESVLGADMARYR
jgi:hypothetical protein